MILVSPHSHSRWMAPPETPRSVEMAGILLPFARVSRLSELWLGGVSALRKSILLCFFQCFCCKAQGLNIGAPFINMLFCVVIYLVLCASQDPSENHQNEHNVAFYCAFQRFCAHHPFVWQCRVRAPLFRPHTMNSQCAQARTPVAIHDDQQHPLPETIWVKTVTVKHFLTDHVAKLVGLRFSGFREQPGHLRTCSHV